MKKYCALVLFAFLMCSGCSKYLDHKQANSDLVPVSLKDLQAVLDDAATMNGSFDNGAYPSLGLVGSDNYYVTYTSWQSQFVIDQHAYLWDKDVFQNYPVQDWDNTYKIIFNANVVLEGLKEIKSGRDPLAFNTATGGALFYRAHALFSLAQLFCKPFVAASAGTDAGIPVRTTADINIPSTRATVLETYNQIITDLKNALAVLPVTTAPVQIRPDKPAAQSLLSRVYLNMEMYDSAWQYADNVLKIKNSLLDFNQLNANSGNPFPAWPNNKEIIHYALIGIPGILDGTEYRMDTVLIKSYDSNDLRKSLFYRPFLGGYVFKGKFAGTAYRFGGIATDELYFIRAECYARMGKTTEAINDLNTLLVTRWKTGTFIPFTAPDGESALRIILKERRKEFPFTGSMRWQDLRRLNHDARFAVTLTRLLNGQTYTLPPNDNRYVYPLPEKEIQVYHLEQNPR